MSPVRLAPFVFVLLWSTGFVGAKYGLPYAGPFTFLFVRMVAVVVILTAVVLITRSRWPTSRKQILHIGVSGLLLHAGYLGGVFFAISRGLPAGISALMVGLQPILTAIFAQTLLHERVNRWQWLGLLLGFAGVALVVEEKALAASSKIAPSAFVAIGLALLCTTLGTIYQKRFASDMPLVGGTVVQYIAAGAALGLAALLSETMQIRWTPHFIFALSWLTLVLSVGAVLLLMYLIRSHSASRVSSFFYLVPPATAIEAYFLFGERLGWLAIFGMALAAIGVALVVRR
jgi:drug/metabolite transporter (DMT)-like permease